MYFNERENTNIDKELRKKKKIKFDMKKLIVGGIILGVIIIALLLIFFLMKTPRYSLNLNGDKEITIYQGSVYNELGYEAHDNKNNNLNGEVSIQSNLDPNTIGTYTITYTLYNKTKTRVVKVIERPAIITVVYLNGDKNMTISLGSTYEEPGYSAVDAIDGDLTNKVKINGHVDTSKRGTYSITYSVVNSQGVTTAEVRTVTVQ